MPKGHEKDASRTSQDNSVTHAGYVKDVTAILSILDSVAIRTNPFGSNVSGEAAYRRSERICAAVHVMTNHVPESEHLRLVIRKKGIDLMSYILQLRSGLRTAESEMQQQTLSNIRELISLVRLLAISGYASAQNAQALSEALDELGNLITTAQRSSLAEQYVFEREDLIPTALKVTNISQRDTGGEIERVSKKPTSARPKLARIYRGEAGSARADHIMDILKIGGFFGIKDIATNLPQYSEKMVQRELAELVRLNKIQKMGSKRWSRYQIVQ